jgi:kynurenine formamidase
LGKVPLADVDGERCGSLRHASHHRATERNSEVNISLVELDLGGHSWSDSNGDMAHKHCSGGPMKLIDLSRELYHRTPAHPSHPPIAVATWYDHDEVKTAGSTRFSSKALFLSMSDHAGTHVDAPCHFNPDPSAASIDQLPLEDFFTEAICLDLSHVPLKHEITVAEMEEALVKSGQAIKRRDTVLINMGVNARLFGKPGYASDFPGLHVGSVHWLADHGILMFGVEAVSPAPQGEANFKAHLACAERGITHIECLWNLEAVVGQGRFKLIAFPLRIRGGTASPVRAVAMLDG